MKLAIEHAPEWVRDIVKSTKKRPKTITLHVVAANAVKTFSAFAGDGERQYTWIRRAGSVATETRQSSWGGANIFAQGREKATNEGFAVTFTPGTQVLEALYPKYIGFCLSVSSVDECIKHATKDVPLHMM